MASKIRKRAESILRDEVPSQFDEEAEKARLFEYIAWLSVALTSVTFIVLFLTRRGLEGKTDHELVDAFLIALFMWLVLFLVRLGKRMTATLILTVGSLLITTILIYRYEGVYAPFPIYYVIVILLAGVFLSIKLSMIFAFLCISIYTFIVVGQLVGWLPSPGRYTYFDMTIIALLGRNVSFIGVALLMQMLSQLLTMRQHAIELREKKYRELVESAPDMIISINYDGKIMEVNQRACDVLGYSREEFLGMLGTELVFPEDRATLRAYFVSLMRTGAPRMIEIDLKTKDGMRIPAEINHGLIEEGDKVIGVRAIIRDITARKRMEEERNGLRERLMLSEKLAALGQLVLGISHEYNNILAGLRGLSEVAQLPGKKERLVELPHKIIQLVERAQEITSGLLGFAQRFQPSFTEVSLAKIVSDVEQLTAYDLELRKISIQSKVPQDIIIYTDVGKLQEVLLNLVLNARDAMPNGGIITISASLENQLIKIKVSDTGVGIPPEHLHRIFDPFFTTKGPLGGGHQQGTGLGLSLCYGVVKSLGGDILVESEVGRGTTFTIVIPHRRPERREDGAMEEKGKSEGQSRNVLIVEDESAIRLTLAEYLETLGHKVFATADGDEAYNIVERTGVDIAFVDLLMPGISGEDFMNKAHQKQPQMLFVIITGKEFLSEEEKKRVEALPNVVCVIRKPFPYEKAKEIIEKECPK